MNKIVREHYPVEKLPEDLRSLVGGAESVTVELTEEDAPPLKPLTRDEAVAMMRQSQQEHAARGSSITTEEAVRRVRELRRHVLQSHQPARPAPDGNPIRPSRRRTRDGAARNEARDSRQPRGDRAKTRVLHL